MSSTRGARRDRRAFGAHPPWRKEPTLPAPLSSQRMLKTIASDEIHDQSDGDLVPAIQNVKLVASFNWITAAQPTIVVPGCPPKWQPPALPQFLQGDDGVYYRDPNAAHFPLFPSEPAIRAVIHQNPSSENLNTDIFACGNTIGCLLSVVRDEERNFRFGVERVGQTIFLVRKTNTPSETIKGVRGYGHTFPEAYTIWEDAVQDSASHQRVIKYNFMDMNLMVRSECDGYLPELLSQSELDEKNNGLAEPVVKVEPGDSPPDLHLNQGSVSPEASSQLTLTSIGHTIPQHAIFDLKTRCIKVKESDSNNLETFYPRLWASQTPNFVLAFHDQGKFDMSNIQVHNVAGEVSRWERQNANLLGRLASLLRMLTDLSKEKRFSCFEVRRIAKGPVEVWSEAPGWSALPEDLKVAWTEVNEGKSSG